MHQVLILAVFSVLNIFVLDRDDNAKISTTYGVVGCETSIVKALRNVSKSMGISDIDVDTILPDNPYNYQEIFVTLGLNSSKTSVGKLTDSEDSILHDYVVNGGNLYIESPDFNTNMFYSKTFSLTGTIYGVEGFQKYTPDSAWGCGVMLGIQGTYAGLDSLIKPTSSILYIDSTAGSVSLFTDKKDGQGHLLAAFNHVKHGANGGKIVYFNMIFGLLDSNVQNDVMRRIQGLFYPDLLVISDSKDTAFCGNLHNAFAQLISDTAINGFDFASAVPDSIACYYKTILWNVDTTDSFPIWMQEDLKQYQSMGKRFILMSGEIRNMLPGLSCADVNNALPVNASSLEGKGREYFWLNVNSTCASIQPDANANAFLYYVINGEQKANACVCQGDSLHRTITCGFSLSDVYADDRARLISYLIGYQNSGQNKSIDSSVEKIKVFPFPLSGTLVKYSNMEVYTIDGRNVLSFKSGGGYLHYSLTSLPAGRYIVKLYTDSLMSEIYGIYKIER